MAQIVEDPRNLNSVEVFLVATNLKDEVEKFSGNSSVRTIIELIVV